MMLAFLEGVCHAAHVLIIARPAFTAIDGIPWIGPTRCGVPRSFPGTPASTSVEDVLP